MQEDNVVQFIGEPFGGQQPGLATAQQPVLGVLPDIPVQLGGGSVGEPALLGPSVLGTNYPSTFSTFPSQACELVTLVSSSDVSGPPWGTDQRIDSAGHPSVVNLSMQPSVRQQPPAQRVLEPLNRGLSIRQPPVESLRNNAVFSFSLNTASGDPSLCDLRLSPLLGNDLIDTNDRSISSSLPPLSLFSQRHLSIASQLSPLACSTILLRRWLALPFYTTTRVTSRHIRRRATSPRRNSRQASRPA